MYTLPPTLDLVTTLVSGHLLSIWTLVTISRPWPPNLNPATHSRFTDHSYFREVFLPIITLVILSRPWQPHPRPATHSSFTCLSYFRENIVYSDPSHHIYTLLPTLNLLTTLISGTLLSILTLVTLSRPLQPHPHPATHSRFTCHSYYMEYILYSDPGHHI